MREKYKYYSPLSRWMGGKFYLADTINQYIPPHLKYMEPFCGAAWVFFKKRFRSYVEILNDYDGNLVNFWRVIKNDLDGFLKAAEFVPHSREIFYEYCEKFQDTDIDPATRAWMFFYILKLCYGGSIYKTKTKVFNQKYSASRPVTPLEHMIEIVKLASKRLQGVVIENKSYSKLIPLHDAPDTFFYCDPPYWSTEKYYKSKKDGTFTTDEHIKLRELLGGIKGKFLLSYNDCPEIRGIWAGYNFVSLTTRWSIGSRYHNDTQRRELLICNYDPPECGIVYGNNAAIEEDICGKSEQRNSLV